MIRRPIIKYFGSKWTAARKGLYPAPRFDTIIERCCGGAAYALQYPERQVFLSDIDPEMCALWQWLIGADASEIMSLPVATLQHGQDLRELPVRREAADLIRRWQRLGRNDCWTVSKWNNMPGQWQESVKTAIVEALPQIRHWQVKCCSWEELTIDALHTEFVDPTYQFVKGYKHEKIDYVALAAACRQWRDAGHQVIVCEQLGANWLPFRELYSLNAGCAHHPKKQSTEMIWP